MSGAEPPPVGGEGERRRVFPERILRLACPLHMGPVEEGPWPRADLVTRHSAPIQRTRLFALRSKA